MLKKVQRYRYIFNIYFMNKICNKCNVDKDIEDFYKHRNTCKKCCYENMKKYKDKETYKEYQKNYHSEYKDTDKRKSYKKEYYINNKEKIKKYNEENEDIKKEYRKEYYLKNKIRLNQRMTIYMKEYDRNRKLNDPEYKLRKYIRSLFGMAFKLKGIKKNTKTEHILGCTIQEFKTYIENKFENWMTWEKHSIYTGNYNETWQLDHIEPISNAKTEEDIIRLNHYTNFQPLCSKKNIEKSNKF